MLFQLSYVRMLDRRPHRSGPRPGFPRQPSGSGLGVVVVVEADPPASASSAPSTAQPRRRPMGPRGGATSSIGEPASGQRDAARTDDQGQVVMTIYRGIRGRSPGSARPPVLGREESPAWRPRSPPTRMRSLSTKLFATAEAAGAVAAGSAICAKPGCRHDESPLPRTAAHHRHRVAPSLRAADRSPSRRHVDRG